MERGNAQLLGLGAQNEVLKNAWMLPLIGGMTTFWPTRWVGLEDDPAARDWSISVATPFFPDGRWAGSVGHAMRVSRQARRR